MVLLQAQTYAGALFCRSKVDAQMKTLNDRLEEAKLEVRWNQPTLRNITSTGTGLTD